MAVPRRWSTSRGAGRRSEALVDVARCWSPSRPAFVSSRGTLPPPPRPVCVVFSPLLRRCLLQVAGRRLEALVAVSRRWWPSRGPGRRLEPLVAVSSVPGSPSAFALFLPLLLPFLPLPLPFLPLPFLPLCMSFLSCPIRCNPPFYCLRVYGQFFAIFALSRFAICHVFGIAILILHCARYISIRFCYPYLVFGAICSALVLAPFVLFFAIFAMYLPYILLCSCHIFCYVFSIAICHLCKSFLSCPIGCDRPF